MWQILLPAAITLELGALVGAWRSRTLLKEAKASHQTSVRLGRAAARNEALEAIEDLYMAVQNFTGPITSPSNDPGVFYQEVQRYREAMATTRKLDRMYSRLQLSYQTLPFLLGPFTFLIPLGTLSLGFAGGFPNSVLGWSPLVLGAVLALLCIFTGAYAMALEQRIPLCAELYSDDGDPGE